MKQVTTYVGIDAHKKDLFIAMLIGQQKTPVTWQLANEPQAVRRLISRSIGILSYSSSSQPKIRCNS